MPTRRILVPWIGYADFRALAATLPPDRAGEVLSGLNPPTPLAGQAGPLKTLLDRERFDEVHLLTSHTGPRNRLYAEWVGGNPVLHWATVNNPTDFAEVLKLVAAELAWIIDLPRSGDEELCVHLSPRRISEIGAHLLPHRGTY